MAENGFAPSREFLNISYLVENLKLRLLRDVCTLCAGALASDSLLHMLPYQIKKNKSLSYKKSKYLNFSYSLHAGYLSYTKKLLGEITAS